MSAMLRSTRFVSLFLAARRVAMLCSAVWFFSVPCVAAGLGSGADSAAQSPAENTALALTTSYALLPDAPEPQLADAPAAADLPLARTSGVSFSLVNPDPVGAAPPRTLSQYELDQACQTGKQRGKPCRVSWLPMLWEAFEATAVETTGNIVFDSDTRDDLTHNPYLATWFKCVHQYRYRQWSDDTPFIVHDIGHPMQGASVYSIFAQNDPKSRGLIATNNGNYWRGKLKAMAFVTLYEIQWKIGPVSEASIGNSGLNTYLVPGTTTGRTTNETGFQDFVITPVYGLGWNIAEDLVDKYVMPHIWKRTHNRLILMALLPLTPCRDAANLLRYKPPYYRDYPITPLR